MLNIILQCFHDTYHVLLVYTRDLQSVKKLSWAVPDFVTFTSGHFETSNKKTARNSSGSTDLNISYALSLFHLLNSYTPTSFDIRHSHGASQTHRGRTGPSYLDEKLSLTALCSPRGHRGRAEEQRADTQPARSTSTPRSVGQAATRRGWSKSRDRRQQRSGAPYRARI